MKKIKLLLLLGGQSTEHVISRMSATYVYQQLDRNRYDVTCVGIDKLGNWNELDGSVSDFVSDSWLEKSKKILNVYDFIQSFDVAFPVLHGLYGEDGTIQGLFELTKIPYVGCKVLDSSIAMDKIYTKKVLNCAGIKQVDSVYVKKRNDGTFVVINEDVSETKDVEKYISEQLGYPCFVKASRSGSSVGCYKVLNANDLMKKIQEASLYDSKIVVEKCISCIELECAILGNDDPKASVVGEILPAGEYYTFDSKYNDKNSDTLIPARISQEVSDYIRSTAIKAFKAIDGHGLARVDFFLDKDTHEIYLNEINTMPGFTAISMYPKLWEASGIQYSELLDCLVMLSLEEHPK